MPVFNPQQVLSSPVTSFYKGKAMRAQQEAADLANKKSKFEADHLDEVFDMKKAEAKMKKDAYKLQQDKMKLEREKFESEVGKDKAKEFAVQGWGIIHSIDTAVGNKEIDEKGALSMAAEKFAEYAQGLPDDRKLKMAEVLKDGLTIDEYRQIKGGFAGALEEYKLLDKDDDGSYTLSQGAKRYGSNNQEVASNPKPDASKVTPTELQKELQPLVERGVITQEQMDQIILDKGKKAAAPTGGSDEAIESQDSALIMRAAHASYGGLFGPNGELMPLEKGVAEKMTKRAALAEKLFIEAGGAMGHQAAVEKAMEAEGRASATVHIANDEEYRALESGQEFIGPDGVKRTKP